MEAVPEEPKPTWTDGWRLGVVQLVFVIGVIAIAVGLSRALAGQVEDRAPRIADLRGNAELSVRIADTPTRTYTPTLRINGTVQANAEISVSPQVSGEIKRVSAAFRAGSGVKKGDLLFEIDRADYVLAVQRAEAEIASARSDLKQLEAEAALARQEWEELFPDREVNDLAARIPQIEAAEARLESAEANKRTSELALQRTRVYAPLDARVLASSLDIGQIVSPGQVVGRMVALDSIEIAAPVSNDQMAMLDPVIGRVGEFQRRGSGAASSAVVVRVDASVNARTRLSNLYLLPADQSGLRIGDFVDVSIASDKVEGAVRLPATALKGQAQVWVIDSGQLASRRITVLGELDFGQSIIAAPFDLADGVVALAPLEAEEGQPVSVRAAPSITANTGG
ncbi:MAG: efflux RND transporter periplasmic adaptor subunit [Pseudomonadota bacterium]